MSNNSTPNTENISETEENLWSFEYEAYMTHNWLIRKFPGIFLDASSLIKYFEYQRRQKSDTHNELPLVKQLDTANKKPD